MHWVKVGEWTSQRHSFSTKKTKLEFKALPCSFLGFCLYVIWTLFNLFELWLCRGGKCCGTGLMIQYIWKIMYERFIPFPSLGKFPFYMNSCQISMQPRYCFLYHTCRIMLSEIWVFTVVKIQLSVCVYFGIETEKLGLEAGNGLPSWKFNDQLFPCEVCGKVFGRQQTLSRHLSLHTGKLMLCCYSSALRKSLCSS